MEGHARKCVERYCELAKTEQLYKVSTPCFDDHSCKEEELETSKCVHVARLGRSDILWSVNKFNRAVTNLARDCNKRLARLISYIHLTSDIVMWVIRLIIVDCDCSKTQTLLVMLKIRNQHRRESYVSSEVEHLFP